MSPLSALLIKLAHAIMPLERRDWAEAMEAEYAHVTNKRAGFLAGCLWSAIMASLTNQARILRIGLLLLALSLFGLATYRLWYAMANLDIYMAELKPYPVQAYQFLYGQLFFLGLCVIGGAGAVLAARQASNQPAMARICARTIARVALAIGAGYFLMLGVFNIWQSGALDWIIGPVMLLGILFVVVGWVGESGPRQLRDAGLVGMIAGILMLLAASLFGKHSWSWVWYAQLTLVLMASVAASGAMLHWVSQNRKR